MRVLPEAGQEQDIIAWWYKRCVVGRGFQIQILDPNQPWTAGVHLGVHLPQVLRMDFEAKLTGFQSSLLFPCCSSMNFPLL